MSRRLRELGWIEGRTVAIEYRWGEGRSERFAEIAAEFVRLKVDVIVTAGSAVPAIDGDLGHCLCGGRGPPRRGLGRKFGATGRQRHRPVGSGTDLAGKRTGNLRDAVPGLRRLAIMANVGMPEAAREMGEVQATARALGLTAALLEIRRAEDIGDCVNRSKDTRMHFMFVPTAS